MGLAMCLLRGKVGHGVSNVLSVDLLIDWLYIYIFLLFSFLISFFNICLMGKVGTGLGLFYLFVDFLIYIYSGLGLFDLFIYLFLEEGGGHGVRIAVY